MPNIRISLIAVALLLAVTPDDASANSDQYCESQWLLSPASDSCTTDLNVEWKPVSEDCSVSVMCTKNAGGLKYQLRIVTPQKLSQFKNCNGTLSLVWVCGSD